MLAEVYTGHPDKTWSLHQVEIPDDTPSEDIERRAVDAFYRLYDADRSENRPEISFAGLYYYKEETVESDGLLEEAEN